MTTKRRETKIWLGSHDGLDFEINNFHSGGEEYWTYYLIIKLNRIPGGGDQFWLEGVINNRGFADYNYNRSDVINNIDFHYGCTYYRKISGFDGSNKSIKIGCDYSHLWDEGHTYNIEEIKRDVIDSIESFRKIVPRYKYWCQGNGGLYDLDEGQLKGDVFYSNEYIRSVK
jgi:hypothetical protein